MTSYNVAFLSPDPVTMYLSSVEMSQLKTEDDSLDCNKKNKEIYMVLVFTSLKVLK